MITASSTVQYSTHVKFWLRAVTCSATWLLSVSGRHAVCVTLWGMAGKKQLQKHRVQGVMIRLHHTDYAAIDQARAEHEAEAGVDITITAYCRAILLGRVPSPLGDVDNRGAR